MKLSFPLSLKVTLWLLLNLLLLAVVGLGFFFVQSGVRWDSLVSGPAGEHVQELGNLIGSELANAPSAARDAVLARFGTAYGVEFYLFRNDGEQLAGKSITLPGGVQKRLETRGPRDGPPPRSRPEAGEFGPPPDRRPPPEDRPPPPRGAPVGRGRFLMRTSDPVKYWIGLRLPVEEDHEASPIPATLITMAPTLGAAVRFLDWQPWLMAGVGVLGLSVLFWLPVVRSITRALGQLTAATERIAEGRFDTRVDASRRDELGRLGHAVNQMAARLDTFVSGQKRFLGDVSHELCSPLARLQMAVGILEERNDPALKQAITDVREEVQQMSALVNELLAFSKAGLRAREVVLGPVELAPLVARVLERENAGRVTVKLMPGLVAMAEGELLERALGNLVRNALRYGGNGPIHLSAHTESGEIVLSLFDEGPGVPPESLAQLGEPFYRPEAARTREGGGVGLGLAIVKSCAEACGGQLVLRNRAPHGFLAELHLQSAAAAA